MITVADSKSWHMQQALHGHGKGFFMYAYRCVEQPRLLRTDRYTKKDRSVASTWSVDGVDHPDLESAVKALNSPPTFSAEEMDALRCLRDDWMPAKTARELITFEMSWRLRDKGAIEFADGKCRRSEIGRGAASRWADETHGDCA